MDMDGRDSAKCRKSKIRDIIGIIEILNDNKDKLANSAISYNSEDQNVNERDGDSESLIFRF